MKHLLAIVCTLVVCLPLGGAYAQVTKLKASPAQERTIELINYFVQRYHYRPARLNDELSSRILDRFVESLDANRSYFLASDIQRFEQMRFRIDDDLRLFQLESIFNVFDVYRERVAGRSEFVEEALVRGFQFDIDENYQFDRTDARWAVDSTELNDIWRKRIKNEFLVLKLAGQSKKQILKMLGGRYRQLNQRTSQLTAENVFETFVNAYLSAVEPRTSYFSPGALSPAVEVSPSDLGIGAVLQTRDEHTVVQQVVAGGPAEVSGLLHSGDKIIGVGQGTKTPMINVIGWRLDDVVKIIRGDEGTSVSLEILPRNQPPGGLKRIISIVRGKSRAGLQVPQRSILNFTDTESKIVGTTRKDDDTEVEGFKCDALLIEIGRILADSVNIGHKQIRIGVIRIPTFYIDFEGRSAGKPDYKSVTRDVRRLISTLGPEKIDGLIVDLRGNGGGALTEAADLTGLFLESGPIYQTKDAKDQIKINNDPSFTIEYSGPLLVVVDRDTAGGSEILAGAVQDYRRGIIVGEQTFGLGTVGNLVDLKRYARSSEEILGQMKFTIAELYRVNGDSIQQHGVTPDIVLPVVESNDDHGEKKFDNALPWSHIAPTDYKSVANSEFDKFLTQFRKLYEHRIHSDAEFSLLIKRLRFHDSAERKTSISLLAAKRIEKQTEKQKASKTTSQTLLAKTVDEAKIEWMNGTYTGQVSDGVPHGQGSWVHLDLGKYAGEFENGFLNGQGTFTKYGGINTGMRTLNYVGNFKDNMFHGHGTWSHPNGQKYVGEFSNGKRNGQGVYTYSDGSRYIGQFKFGERDGWGTYTWAHGSEYVGEFKDDNPWKGTEYDKSRNVIAIYSESVRQPSSSAICQVIDVNGQSDFIKQRGSFTPPMSDADKRWYLGQVNSRFGKRIKENPEAVYVVLAIDLAGCWVMGFSSASNDIVSATKSAMRSCKTKCLSISSSTTGLPKSMDEVTIEVTQSTQMGNKYIFGSGLNYGDIYIGPFTAEGWHGQGTYIFADGRKYVGEFKYGNLWNGTEYDKDGKVTATWTDGVMTEK